MKVPIVDLALANHRIRTELLTKIGTILDSGDFVLGAEVAAFEREFAALHRSKNSIGVASGTDALILSLKALGIGRGDEVITVANSFVATVAAIVVAGAKPVFVDVGEDENIDPYQIERAITSRTKGVIPVHLRGRPASMPRIVDVARAHGLYVIEDCAQAVCALYDGQPVGTFGDIGCFSLHPLKNLGACGDAGVIITNDAGLADRLRMLRNHGLLSRDECIMWGLNARLDSLQAAILNVKLRYLEQWIARRRQVAATYIQAFSDLPLTLPREGPHEYMVYYQFVVQTPRRDAVQRFLKESGVDARVYYPTPVHLLPMCRAFGMGEGDLPRTEQQRHETLALPIFAEISDEQVDYVLQAVHDFFRGEH